MEKVSPFAKSLLCGVASELVSLMSWMAVSRLVHVTLVPGFTMTFCGLNSKLTMSTGASPDSGTEPLADEAAGLASLSSLESLPQPARVRTATSPTNATRNDLCITDPLWWEPASRPARCVFGDMPRSDDGKSAGAGVTGRGGVGRLHRPFGVVARAHQRPGLDVGEAEALGVGAELGELVGVPPPGDGQVEGRRPQVLPQGEDVDAGAAEIGDGPPHLGGL